MTDQGWPGQGNQPSGNGFPPDGSVGDPFNQPHYGQPQNGQPQYGQPHYGQPQYGQPQYGQPQYGQPQSNQFGQPSSGQASYGQTPGGWNGQAPAGFGGQPPKKNWLLYAGIGAGMIIVALLVALILQGLNTGDSPPTTPTSTTQSADSSNAPTDGDGIPVIPVTLKGKTPPDKVGDFEWVDNGNRTYGDTTSMIYRDPSATISVDGTFSSTDVASSVTRGLQNAQRIGNFICGKSPSAELITCAAKTSDGTIYFRSRPETTIATLGELANGVVAGSR